MREKALYIGPAGYGYEPQQEYLILTSIHQGMLWVRTQGGPAELPYQSMGSFLKSWMLLT